MGKCKHGVENGDGILGFCTKCRYGEQSHLEQEEHPVVDSFEAMSRPIGLRLMERQGD